MLRKLLLLLFIGYSCISYSQITVDTNVTALKLAQKLVGSGVTIYNPTLIAASNMCGIFKSKNGALPIDSGIVLTTGCAKTRTNASSITGGFGVDGKATSSIVGADTKRYLLGDSDLTNLINFRTFDACVLEFDFIPESDSINIRYFFGSEEYTIAQCTSVNDVFAFFISGIGYNGLTNIALIPNTNFPVSLHSINNGLLGTFGDSSYCYTAPGLPATNLYYDNSTSNYLIYNGRTVILTAKAWVKCGTAYHIKLVIADGGDMLLDSGVFLESITSPKKASIYPQNFYKIKDSFLLVERCHPQATLKLVRGASTPKNAPFTVNISCTGTATYGVDYTPIDTIINFAANQDSILVPLTITDDGIGDDNETLIIKLKTQGTICSSPISTDSIYITIKEKWVYPGSFDTTICSNKSIILKSSYADSTVNSFIWNDGKNTAKDTVQTGKYWVNATFKNTCVQSDSFNINAINFSVFASANDSICKGDSIKITYKTNTPRRILVSIALFRG